jgi:hypothetical protein
LVLRSKVSRTPFESKLRHWPPGTIQNTGRAAFFCLRPSLSAIAGRGQRYHRNMKRLVGTFALVLATLAASAQFTGPTFHSASDIPAFNAAAPTHRLPPILSGTQLMGTNFTHTYQVAAYKMAAQVSPVLYQEPCYCRCDKAMGHNSLHSCFEGLHGAECSTCMKEGVYTYRETKKGRSPAQIRAGIERGEWMNVDLEAVAL